jgi:hypothetical protein
VLLWFAKIRSSHRVKRDDDGGGDLKKKTISSDVVHVEREHQQL